MTKKSPTVYKSLGELITTRLAELDMKPAELARKVGKTPQYIGDLAADKKDNPSLDVIEALATHLEVSKLEILVALGYLPAEVLVDPEGARLLEQIRRLSADKQEVVRVIVSSLSSHFGNGKSNGGVSVAIDPPKRQGHAKKGKLK